MEITVKTGDVLIVDGLPRKVKLEIEDSRVGLTVEGYLNKDENVAWLDFFGMEGCGLEELEGIEDAQNQDEEAKNLYKHPRIVIWGDKDDDEPTHSISLEKAATATTIVTKTTEEVTK